MSLNPNNEQCARCGEIATGHAFIGESRYCHPDDGPSCYSQQQSENSAQDAYDNNPALQELLTEALASPVVRRRRRDRSGLE